MRKYTKASNVMDYGLTFDPKLPSISNRIADCIQEKGIMYKEAASRIGISRQALDAFVRGDLQPTIEVALKLSLLFNEPIEKLFTLQRGAWFQTAKDDDGRTIFYDHVLQELRSGKDMKGVIKSDRFNMKTNETMSQKGFERIVKEAEEEAVRKAVAEDQEGLHNRDTLARVKEAVRSEFEGWYPKRYETMYTEIPNIERND